MFTKRSAITLLLSFFAVACHAQGSDFCEAINAILKDAPNQFKNIRTQVLSKNGGSITYKSGITVPGTINSRFVYSMGVFYEGAVFQSKTKDGLKAQYDRYKKLLGDCLTDKGFSLRTSDNFYEGLGDYKKVMFMPFSPDGKEYRKGVGHAAMEADYNKNSGLYSLIFYIFEQ